MRKEILVSLLLFLTGFIWIGSSYSASVDGNAYKVGADEHSGISILLESPPPIPTIGISGILLLVIGLSVLLFARKKHWSKLTALLIILTGAGFTTYAFVQYTTTTSSNGSYHLEAVTAGDYNVTASASGYYSAHLYNIQIADGYNTLPDLYLNPIGTATPVPTDVPTDTPTEIPTATVPPTSTPTESPTTSPTTPPTNTLTPLPTINAWHIPQSAEACSYDAAMRNPEAPIVPGDAVCIYVGIYPIGSATAITLYYKIDNGSWLTHEIIWACNDNSNDYWWTSCDVTASWWAPGGQPGETISYYIEVTNTGNTPTYLYSESAPTRSDSQASAQADPYTFTYPLPTTTPTLSPTQSPTESPSPSPTASPTAVPTIPPCYTAGCQYALDPIIGSMRFVPAGSFTQGSPDIEPCRNGNETQFVHHLTRNLAVMETEVSRYMWETLYTAQPSLPSDPSDLTKSPSLNHPVQKCMWYSAVFFANLLSLHNGYERCYYKDAGFTIPVDASNYDGGAFYCKFDADGYRLPTEGEWEYFCRAGTTGIFSCDEPNYRSTNCYMSYPGNMPILEQHCVFGANSSGTTAVIGSKLPNPWNLKDVHGNVQEWCWDVYTTYPGDSTDYSGPTSGAVRVNRGGTWGYYAVASRSAARNYDIPNGWYNLNGFRLVRTLFNVPPSPTPTQTSTLTPTFSPTQSPTNSPTATLSPTISPTNSPTITLTPTPLPTVNAWHIPLSAEACSYDAAMRNPIAPVLPNDPVCIYAGVYPIGSATTITLHYKINNGSWSTHEMIWTCNDNSNDYWWTSCDVTASWWVPDGQAGDTISYYIEVIHTGNTTTYLYSESAPTRSESQASAQADPYTFTYPLPTSTPTATLSPTYSPTNTSTQSPTETPTNVPTATPTVTLSPTVSPTDTPSPTATPLPIVNAWHIPSAAEACSYNATMRNPVSPSSTTDPVCIYVGVYPIGGASTLTLYYKINNSSWSTKSLIWTCNYNNNDYWWTSCDNSNQWWVPSAQPGDTVYYYIEASNPGNSATYLYSETSPTRSGSQASAEADPYRFTYPLPTPTATFSPTVTPSPTPSATPTISFCFSTGCICGIDAIVGNLRYVSAGTFLQGSPSGEACNHVGETPQFSHTLTLSMAVMETEVSRQMWASLKAAQTTLPNDPSDTSYSPSLSHPVQQTTWYEAVLFANLLSVQDGLVRCYYTDSAFTNPITASNYTSGPFYCDFNANGYRLPSEGEWEYFCRAGTTDAFSCNETNYNSGTCTVCTNGLLPTLEQYSVFCANSPTVTAVVGSKLANPWNIKDVHGNVFEWVWDAGEAYTSSSKTDYRGVNTSSPTAIRMNRSGGYYVPAWRVRSAVRYSDTPTYRANSCGFRLVRTISTSDAIVGTMRYISGGNFTQGSPNGEACRISNEPQFNHTLTRNLAVMETEISRQMWATLKAVQASLPNDPSDTAISSTLAHPVQQVKWKQSVLFANLLSLQNGYDRCYYQDAGFSIPIDASNYTQSSFYCNFSANGYRLPSEGEWEYFCRAGTTGPFSCSEPNYNSGTCSDYTSGLLPILEQYTVFGPNSSNVAGVVGSKLANPWNLKDVHGNVWEWCWDVYAAYPGSATDYTGPASGSFKVVRGGAWNYDAQRVRSAFRLDRQFDTFSTDRGFRLVRTLIRPSFFPTPTPTLTATLSPTVTLTPTVTPSLTPTYTYTATGTPTLTPTLSPTLSPTLTPTATPTTTLTPTITPTFTPVPTNPGALIAIDAIIGNLRLVAPGSYTQGSAISEPCRNSNESPQGTHTLTRTIGVMETEITRQMWVDLSVVQTTLPSDPSTTSISPTLAHPVQHLTWFEAVLFANLLSVQNRLSRCYYKDTGFTTPVDATNYSSEPIYCNFNANGYRLPFEGEWEYFSRAGTTGYFSFSENNYSGSTCTPCNPSQLPILAQYCVYCGNSSNMAAVVGSKLSNPWNLKDMNGNVQEWCWDWYSATNPGNVTDYTGPSSGSFRVRRPGGWGDLPSGCRSAVRSGSSADSRYNDVGFRLVRTLYATDPIVGRMWYIPSGIFTQGSPSGEACRSSNETQFVHTLTRNIAVMETEITRQMWSDLRSVQASLPIDPSDTSVSPNNQYPVQKVLWYEAILFANLLSVQNGLTRCYYTDSGFTTPVTSGNYGNFVFYCNFSANGYRLLSEGEWEYCCRAGSVGAFSFTESNYNGSSCNSGEPGTHPTMELYTIYCANDPGGAVIAGSKRSNSWGLRDMHGNVWEWCWDNWGNYPGNSTDYTGGSANSLKAVRGGAWDYDANRCRSAFRLDRVYSEGAADRGFRLVRTIP